MESMDQRERKEVGRRRAAGKGGEDEADEYEEMTMCTKGGSSSDMRRRWP